jgi:hypothetical protein
LFEREHLEELPRLDAAEFAEAESGAVDPPDACRVRDADAPHRTVCGAASALETVTELTVRPSSATALVMASTQLFTS